MGVIEIVLFLDIIVASLSVIETVLQFTEIFTGLKLLIF